MPALVGVRIVLTRRLDGACQAVTEGQRCTDARKEPAKQFKYCVRLRESLLAPTLSTLPHNPHL